MRLFLTSASSTIAMYDIHNFSIPIGQSLFRWCIVKKSKCRVQSWGKIKINTNILKINIKYCCTQWILSNSFIYYIFYKFAWYGTVSIKAKKAELILSWKTGDEESETPPTLRIFYFLIPLFMCVWIGNSYCHDYI